MLLEKVRAIPAPVAHEIERITDDFNKIDCDIKVIRLPVAHSELIAIELIWAHIKGEVGRKNTTFKMSDVNILIEVALENTKPSTWMKAVHHVEEVKKESWDKEKMQNIHL